MIPPTVHPETGRPYRWLGTPLLEVDPSALPLLNFGLLKAVFESESLPVLFDGEGTHDAALRLVAQLVAHTDDDHIRQIVRAALPDDYKGDTLGELGRMIEDARRG